MISRGQRCLLLVVFFKWLKKIINMKKMIGTVFFRKTLWLFCVAHLIATLWQGLNSRKKNVTSRLFYVLNNVPDGHFSKLYIFWNIYLIYECFPLIIFLETCKTQFMFLFTELCLKKRNLSSLSCYVVRSWKQLKK